MERVRYTEADRQRDLKHELAKASDEVRSWYIDENTGQSTPLPLEFENKYSGLQPAHIDPYRADVLAAREPVRRNIEVLVNSPYPSNVPPSFQEVVRHDHVASREIRALVNYEHYKQWIDSGGLYEIAGDSELETIHDKALHGEALPHDLITLLQRTTLQSTELYRLAVPYGYRLDQVAPARKKMREAIEHFDGDVAVDEPYTHLHIQYIHGRESDSLQEMNGQPNKPCYEDMLLGNYQEQPREIIGILVTYKRTIGTIGTGCEQLTIKERQVVGIRVDEYSEMSDNLRVLFTYLNTQNESSEINQEHEINQERERLIENFIQSNACVKFIVPLSVTAYAHKSSAKKTQTRDALSNAPIVTHDSFAATADARDDL